MPSPHGPGTRIRTAFARPPRRWRRAGAGGCGTDLIIVKRVPVLVAIELTVAQDFAAEDVGALNLVGFDTCHVRPSQERRTARVPLSIVDHLATIQYFDTRAGRIWVVAWRIHQFV